MNAAEMEELQRLSSLLETGMLSKEEYEEAKKRVIKTPAPNPTSLDAPASQSVQSSDELNVQTHYSVARGFASLLTAAGWIQAGIGAVTILYGVSHGGYEGIGSALVGAVLIVGGLLSVAAAQVTRATVDNADHTREILFVLRRRLN